ncbi:MAG: thioredoxin family protein [Puniceicoccales bacterium]|jgi:thioredoxin-related protein|nr:thioredoxin family protein [Puniceicoccales bacterium]
MFRLKTFVSLLFSHVLAPGVRVCSFAVLLVVVAHATDISADVVSAPLGKAPVLRKTPFSKPSPPFIHWHSNLKTAKAKARAEGKDILVVFLCSDGSIWSQNLDTEVFTRPEFVVNAAKLFVFVWVNFPRTYSLSSEEKKRNEALRKAWDVRTYPTVILADKDGRPFAATGYRNVSAADYAKHLSTLQAIRERRDLRLSTAELLSTEAEQARELSLALQDIEVNILLRHYTAEIAKLRKLDPQGSTGLLHDIALFPKINRLRDYVLQLVRQKRDYEKASQAVDKFIAETPLYGEHLQKVLFLKLPTCANNDICNYEAVIKLMEKIIKIDPNTEHGKMATEVLQHTKALQAEGVSARNEQIH